MKYFHSLLICLLVSSCVTVQDPPWKWSKTDLSIYIPNKQYSIDEAISNIFGLQSVIWVNGIKPSDIYVDKYLLKMRFKQIQVEERKKYVPTSGGFFVGWNYYSYSGGSYQTSYITIEKETILDIPFKDIEDFLLSPSSIVMHLKNGKNIDIYFDDPYSLKKFGDSIYSILYYHNHRLPPIVGFSFSETKDQEKISYIELKNRNSIVYVENVFLNSPAEAAGLSNNDIILEINGTSIQNAEQCAFLLNNSLEKIINEKNVTGNTSPIAIKVLHFEENKERNISLTRNQIKNINWQIRLIKMTPLIR